MVVVSAVSGLTNQLQGLIDRELDAATLAAETAAIRDQHLQLIEELGIEAPATTLDWLDRLATLAQQAPARRSEFRWQADCCGWGN